MTDAIYGTFTRFSGPVKERGVMVLQIEVPEEHAKRVLDLLGFPESGTSTWVAVARLKERPMDKAKVERQEKLLGQEPAKPRRKFLEMRRSEQAGMLCKDAVFQRWLGVDNQYDARDVVVQRCGVLSRSDLDTDAHATAVWQQELERFDQDTGRTAELRS